MSDVKFDRLKALEGEIGVILLDRPKALNALTLEMIRLMQSQLESWQADNSIKAVLVQSLSEKAFCAGGDIVSLYNEGKKSPKTAHVFFKEEYHLNEYIYQYKKPYICLLDGITMGGGVGISLHGNCPIATENFSFAMPETGIGFFPDVGGSRLLSNCSGVLGRYLGLTGKRIGVSDAVFSGLVDNTIKSDHQEAFIESLCNSELSNNPIARVKDIAKEYRFTLDESTLQTHEDEINRAFDFSTMEEIFDALKQSETDFSEKTLSILSKKSPTSLKVTLEQIIKGKGKSMAECMEMEYQMVKHFMTGHDFYEGVRALLIDKDKMPRWQPNTIEDVSVKMVNAYFDGKC